MKNQQGALEAPKGTASDGKTELFNVPGYPLMVRAVDFNRLHAENERLSGLCDKWNSECDEFREDNKRLAALVETQQPAPSAAAANGWKLVPVKETPEMLTAVYHMVRPGTWLEVAQTVWRTMVNAAPQPFPTPQADSAPRPRQLLAQADPVSGSLVGYFSDEAPPFATRPTPQADSVTAPAGGAMDGWKLAPEEPTLHMGWAYLDAARESDPLRTHTFNHAGYRAMLAAAPTPPAEAQADAITPPPIECNTEELKRAYAFGWWSALEKQRETAQAVAVPLTGEQIEVAAPEYSVDDFLDFNAGVRFAEQYHGIKGGQHG